MNFLMLEMFVSSDSWDLYNSFEFYLFYFYGLMDEWKKVVCYFVLTFTIEGDGKLPAKLHHKRDDFDFHIVNFPFLSSNIPFGPSYDIYIWKLIRYARCCSYYD